MTPKEKAKELVDKMYLLSPLQKIKFYSNSNMAKGCALIAVDEILRVHRSIEDYVFIKTAYTITFDTYWYEVKQEIEKL